MGIDRVHSTDTQPSETAAEDPQELQRRIAACMAQIDATNKELQAFAYSVSHDLRSPLHHIGGFAEALADELDGQLSTDARRYLDRIRDGVDQMAGLIDVILDLSRLGQVALTRMNVDMAALAVSVVEELRGRGHKTFQFTLNTDARVWGDGGLLRQMLEHLLDNAVKFSQQRSSPEIEFGSQRDSSQGEFVFYVRDNGVGFDPAKAEHIFAPFQRLHRPDAYEGRGVGLAIAQRIVARHGGRIWSESSLGDGATFYFTLPELSPEVG